MANGLADNRLWILGMIYVNRDDPSIFVERRFGLGYTNNFGNPKAVALLCGFLGLIIFIAVISEFVGWAFRNRKATSLRRPDWLEQKAG